MSSSSPALSQSPLNYQKYLSLWPAVLPVTSQLAIFINGVERGIPREPGPLYDKILLAVSMETTPAASQDNSLRGRVELSDDGAHCTTKNHFIDATVLCRRSGRLKSRDCLSSIFVCLVWSGFKCGQRSQDAGSWIGWESIKKDICFACSEQIKSTTIIQDLAAYKKRILFTCITSSQLMDNSRKLLCMFSESQQSSLS